MRSVFSEYHPTANFVYFTCVLLFTMFITNPVILAVSFVSSFFYSMYLGGTKTLKISLKAIFPMFLLVMIINPLFNHNGATILGYFSDGNPFTLESVVYGFVSAFLMSSVMLWFLCINKIITSDKIIYLFGRISPVLSLLISMILRFIPKFKTQFQLVRAAQHCIGKDVSDGTIFQRIKNAVRIFSIMILWSMENSLQTADSMKSRGYGLSHRTAYSPYRFEKRDGIFLIFMFLCTIIVLWGALNGNLDFYYFPLVSNINTDIYSLIFYVVYLIMCVIPLILDIKENRKWKYIQSKI